MNKSILICRFILDYQAEHGYAPTLEEIAQTCGLAGKSGAAYHVAELKRRGALAQVQRYRGLELKAKGDTR